MPQNRVVWFWFLMQSMNITTSNLINMIRCPLLCSHTPKKDCQIKCFWFFFFLSLLGCWWCNLIPLYVGLGSPSDKGSLCELRVAHQTNRVFLWNRSDLGRGIGHSKTYQGWFHCWLKSPLCKKAAWVLQLSLHGGKNRNTWQQCKYKRLCVSIRILLYEILNEIKNVYASLKGNELAVECECNILRQGCSPALAHDVQCVCWQCVRVVHWWFLIIRQTEVHYSHFFVCRRSPVCYGPLKNSPFH